MAHQKRNNKKMHRVAGRADFEINVAGGNPVILDVSGLK